MLSCVVYGSNMLLVPSPLPPSLPLPLPMFILFYSSLLSLSISPSHFLSFPLSMFILFLSPPFSFPISLFSLSLSPHFPHLIFSHSFSLSIQFHSTPISPTLSLSPHLSFPLSLSLSLSLSGNVGPLAKRAPGPVFGHTVVECRGGQLPAGEGSSSRFTCYCAVRVTSIPIE